MHEDFDLIHFDTLREAFIDASSLIYMRKVGFLQQLQESLSLYSVPEVLQEAGVPKEGFYLALCREENLSNDRKLLHCALERGLPLISEDKALLMKAKRAGLLYYNSLMMLNFLFFKQTIDSKEYKRYCLSLRRYARYSEDIWSYGEKVYQRIKGALDE